MLIARAVDLKEFAQRVERMCDFFLNRVEKNGSQDRKVIEDLKEDAADLQIHESKSSTVDGLRNYMHGN